MKTPPVFLILCVAFICTSSGLMAQWQSVRGNLPMWDVADAMDARDSLTAVVAIRSGPPHTVFLTTNGGRTWENRSFPYMWGATDVSMIDSSHLWASTTNGWIYATTDGGRHWTRQFSDSTVTDFMDYVEMFDLNDGVALGDSRPGAPIALLRTTNGGSTWVQMTGPFLIGANSGDVWRRVDFVNSSVGYFFPSPSQNFNMSKTTDGGAHWENTGTDLAYAQIVKFYDEQLGIAVNDPTIFRTANGGETWQTVQRGSQGWGNDLEFLPGDPSKVWYTNWQNLFFSSDTGTTWTTQQFPVANLKARDIVIPDRYCGWLIGDSGRVYRTLVPDRISTDVGLQPVAPQAFRLSANYPNPFNPGTTIMYELPRAAGVRISVCDLLGREIAVLVNERKEPGTHEVRFDASGLPSGVYICRLSAGDHTAVRRILLMK